MKRTKWTDIDNKTRKYVLDRDKKCLICGSTYNLTLAHIFLSRAKGGKGSKDNLVTLCSKCHYYIVDNPIGTKYNELSILVLSFIRCLLCNDNFIFYISNFL